MKSENSYMADSQSSSLPFDVYLSCEPFLVDLAKEAGDEAHEGVDAGEDPDLTGLSLHLLLDRPLDIATKVRFSALLR